MSEDIPIVHCCYHSWEELEYSFGNNIDLSVLCINARSITHKFSELCAHLTGLTKKFCFIIITESWLKKDTDFALEIEGYKSVSLYREHRAGGGIKIFFRDFINVTVLEDFTKVDASYECLVLQAKIPTLGDLLVCGFYRIPGGSLPCFFDQIAPFLQYCESRNALICGDFNVDISSEPKSASTREYLDLFVSRGFLSQISLPSYVCPSDLSFKSCLDHAWHNLKITSKNYVILPNFSDHCPIALLFSLKLPIAKSKINFRDYNTQFTESYLSRSSYEFSLCFPPENSVNEAAEYLSSFLHALQDRYFPIKSKLLSVKRLNSPWVTPDILRCISKKHMWYRLLRRDRISKSSYKKYCKALSYLLNIAEEEYWENKFVSLGSNMRENWKLLNKFLNKHRNADTCEFVIDDVRTSDGHLISKSFCEFFVSYPKSIHDNIPNTTSFAFSNIIQSNPNSMVLIPSTAGEVEEIIRSFKKNGSIDDISTKFLKLSLPYISAHISKLFNLCIQRGVYPDCMKIAKVTPVFKSKTRENIANYRPISVLSNLSKIFENLLYNRVLSFVDTFSLLSNHQYGFRKKQKY